jgi:hypothetical protein
MAGGANSNFGRAFLQQSGMLGRAAGEGQQNSAQMPSSAPSYTPATPNVYNPAFSSVQSAQAPARAPMTGPAQQVQQAGLQALMANMMAQYQNVPGATAMPQQAPMPMPQFRSPALNYRPNIQAVQQNLSRVRPSVYKTDLDNARARIAELEAAEQARQASSDTGYYSGG